MYSTNTFLKVDRLCTGTTRFEKGAYLKEQGGGSTTEIGG